MGEHPEQAVGLDVRGTCPDGPEACCRCIGDAGHDRSRDQRRSGEGAPVTAAGLERRAHRRARTYSRQSAESRS